MALTVSEENLMFSFMNKASLCEDISKEAFPEIFNIYSNNPEAKDKIDSFCSLNEIQLILDYAADEIYFYYKNKTFDWNNVKKLRNYTGEKRDLCRMIMSLIFILFSTTQNQADMSVEFLRDYTIKTIESLKNKAEEDDEYETFHCLNAKNMYSAMQNMINTPIKDVKDKSLSEFDLFLEDVFIFLTSEGFITRIQNDNLKVNNKNISKVIRRTSKLIKNIHTIETEDRWKELIEEIN